MLCQHFNPRSPHGERHLAVKVLAEIFLFQSTLPARGATGIGQVAFAYCSFQSTLPAQGATWLPCTPEQGKDISIHAPRTGSDCLMASCVPAFAISIHAPRTGSDFALIHVHTSKTHFNPRSPHGERHLFQFSGGGAAIISIHAPRTGSDILAYFCRQYSTISIHAPRTGSDESCRGVSMRL